MMIVLNKQILLKYVNYIWHLLRRPSEGLSFIMAFVRGTLYIFWYRLTKRKVIIRFPFLCYAKVCICGTGSVLIDRWCTVHMNTFDHLNIMTLSPRASVKIGRNCTLGGLTVRCGNKITIGENVLTAANIIQDVTVCENYRKTDKGASSSKSHIEITIGNDVWLSGQAIILQESRIGEGCVVGLNCVFYRAEAECHSLNIGNPALRSVPISKIQSLQKGR